MTDMSMHRHRAIVTQSPASIPHESRKHASHMLIGCRSERAVREAHCILKHLVGFNFGHRCSFGLVGCSVHSWFPWVIAMSSFSIFFARRGQSNAV